MTVREAQTEGDTDGAVTPASGEEPARSPGSTRPELHHEPALDGLRGLAVLAVVAFHLGYIDGGFLGVDLFFALSGYLITSLLLVERERSGRTDLGRFWARRARRLLPALVLTVAASAVLILIFTPEGLRPEFRGDILATLGYVANWHSMASTSSYWDMFNQASPLEHAWSLAIEEQFYVAWPLIFLGAAWIGKRRGTRTGTVVAVTAGVGAVVSFSLLALTFDALDTNRAYFSTDTRIGPTLAGAVLATICVRRPQREGHPSTRLDRATWVALAFLVGAMILVNGNDPFYYRGGLVLFTLAALLVITGVTGGPLGPAGRSLAVRPLRNLGLISYGVYLWHWPIITYFDPAGRDWLPQKPRNVDIFGSTLDLNDVLVDGARIALTLAMSIASYKLLEMPIRERRWEQRWGGRRVALAGVVATLLVLGLGLYATRQPEDTQSGGWVGVDLTTDRETVYPDDAVTEDSDHRLLLVGDSGALKLGPGLMEYGEEQGVAVAYAADPECTIVYPEGSVVHADGSTGGEGPCHDQRWDEITSAVEEFRPDTVVYYFANAGMLDYVFDGGTVDDCDAAYTEYLENALTEELAYFDDNDAEVVIASTPYIGTRDEASPRQVDCRNRVYDELAAGPYAPRIADLNTFLAERREENEEGNGDIYIDWVHFNPEGALVVSEWLLPEVLPGITPTSDPG